MNIDIISLDCQKMFVQGMTTHLHTFYDNIRIKEAVNEEGLLTKALSENDFHLLLMDLNVASDNPLDIVKSVKKAFPDLKIIVLSSYSDTRLIKNAFLVGADAFISKRENFEDLIQGITKVMNGERYLGNGLRVSPPARGKSLTSKAIYGDSFMLKNKLTKREKEILQKIAQGMSYKEIANILYISAQTVSVHRKNIMKKLNAKSTATMIKFALENDLV